MTSARKAVDARAAWRSVAELSALRCDAPTLARFVLTQSMYASITNVQSTWPQAEYRYWARFFDEVCVEGIAVVYKRNGKRHRIGAPAVESVSGAKEWYVDDKLHRTDGPAIELADGSMKWIVHGKLHRTVGPAVERAGGAKEWYGVGERHRTDGPAIEWFDGIKTWYFHDRLHRIDGPAVEWADGYNEWWIHDKRHFPPDV